MVRSRAPCLAVFGFYSLAIMDNIHSLRLCFIQLAVHVGERFIFGVVHSIICWANKYYDNSRNHIYSYGQNLISTILN